MLTLSMTLKFGIEEDEYLYKQEQASSSEELEYDTDDVEEFRYRVTYFEETPESCVFECFSTGDAKKRN